MRDGEPVYCLQNPAFLSQIRLCCNGKCLCLDMLNCSLHFAGICTILTEWLKASSISQPDLWITYHQYSAYLFPSSSKGNPKEGSIWHTHQSQVGSFNFPISLHSIACSNVSSPEAEKGWMQLISDGWQYLPWGLGTSADPLPSCFAQASSGVSPCQEKGSKFQTVTKIYCPLSCQSGCRPCKAEEQSPLASKLSGSCTLVAASGLEAAGVD